MSASSRAPPNEILTYLRPRARAIDFAIEVLPTPGGPAKRRIRPRFVVLFSFGRLRRTFPGHLGLRSLRDHRRRRRRRLRRLAPEELADREELEDPVLHVLQGVVVLVEDPLRLDDVEVLLASRRPGQLGDELEVVAQDLRLHRLAGETLELLPLPVDLLADVLGQDERLELLLEPLEVVVPVLALAQLLLDRLQLLAEEHLPLPVAQLLLDLRLDLLLRVEDVDLPLDVDRASAARGPRPRASRGGAAARPWGCRCSRRRGRRAGPGRRPRRGRSRRPRRGGRASWRARPTAPSAPSGARRRRCCAASSGGISEASTTTASSRPSVSWIRIAMPRAFPWRRRRAPPTPRWIGPMAAIVPTVWRSSGVTPSTSWRWVRAKTSCSGLFIAVSMAWRVPGRPAAIGKLTPGKRTALRRGMTGRVWVGCILTFRADLTRKTQG